MSAACQDVLWERQEEDNSEERLLLEVVQDPGDTTVNQEPVEEHEQHVPPPPQVNTQEALVEINLEPVVPTESEVAADLVEEPSFERRITQQHAQLRESMAKGMAQLNTTAGIITMVLQVLRGTVAGSMAAVVMELCTLNQTLTSFLVQLATHVTRA